MADSTQTLKDVYARLQVMQRCKDARYNLLGSRTPQQYWEESEKRFATFPSPKDLNQKDFQANIVMGVTRNAVLSQVSKVGNRVPRPRFLSWTKEGYYEDERSKMYDNLYVWSLQRELADRKQQYTSLGCYLRGSSCVYEGFENTKDEVEIITKIDKETSKPITKKETRERWGPLRQVVPLDEILVPTYYVNDIQELPDVIWRRLVSKESAQAEFGHFKNFVKAKAGKFVVGDISEPFFRNTLEVNAEQFEVVRYYKKPCGTSKDRHIIIVGGEILYDGPLPFNHKKLPFSWAINEPFSDRFLLGMSVPFKVMHDQDIADALWSMMLDKTNFSLQKGLMTDDQDANVRSFLTPGGITQFSKGAKWELAPFEPVQQSEFNMLQEALRQAREDSGAEGGAGAMSMRGGGVTARQAIMAEEEAKRMLGISMSNLEFLERDVALQRVMNIKQFAAHSGKKIELNDVELTSGMRGKFIAMFAESEEYAMKNRAKLSEVEQMGDIMGQPTEAVYITPKWFEEEERIEAEIIPESAYLKSKSVDEAIESERYNLLMMNPLIDKQELTRDYLKKIGKDPVKLISQQAPPIEQLAQAPLGGQAAGAVPMPGQGTLGKQLTSAESNLGQLV